MRFALGWAGNLAATRCTPSPSRLASCYCRPETPHNRRYLRSPSKDLEKPFYKKDPSAATNKGRASEQNLMQNTGSRKHCVFGSPFFFLQVAAEGRLNSYFTNSPNI
jgi:hypothetical protein